MMNKSLFEYLAFRFVSQTENLATEALNYILNNSKTVNNAFVKLISIFDQRISTPLNFKTQVSDTDKAFADLVGFNPRNKPICILEAKFWAGLTDNQPVTYLERLERETPSMLLFLAPTRRTPTLWLEILNRCKDANIVVEELKTIQPEFRFGRINDFHSIGIINWNSLLSYLEKESNLAGEIQTISDLTQLKGLCNRMDEEAFIPIVSTEISPSIAKRNMEFSNLVDEVFNLGLQKKFISTKDSKGTQLKTTTGNYHYGRYFMLGNFCCVLKFDSKKWYELSNTPLWLEVYGKEWNNLEEKRLAREALSKLEFENPPRVFNLLDNPAIVPLKIKLGTEKGRVVQSLYNQLLEIFEILTEYENKVSDKST